MWPACALALLNRFHSYTSKVKKKDGHFGFAPTNGSGCLARAILYMLPVPVLLLVDPTVTPACFLLVTSLFYVFSHRQGEMQAPITGLRQ